MPRQAIVPMDALADLLDMADMAAGILPRHEPVADGLRAAAAEVRARVFPDT